MTQSKKIVALGSLYYEPLLIFHNPAIEPEHLSDLRGLRVAVGVEGSGTKVLSMQILNLNKVTPENTKILSIGGREAADSLINGKLDAAFYVSTPSAPVISELLHSGKVRIMGLKRAEAYAYRLQYLSVLKVPKGVIDLAADIPSNDLKIVATTSQLLARSELHPALSDLLIQAAQKIHGSGGVYERRNQFPAPAVIDFELSEDAERFYKSGPPFLQRYLPFWIASFLTRMKILLIPLIGLLLPLFNIMPPVYRWRIRSRIYRWYADLDDVQQELKENRSVGNVQEYYNRLKEIEDKITEISVPLSYSYELYGLRVHLEMLKGKLLQAGANVCEVEKQD